MADFRDHKSIEFIQKQKNISGEIVEVSLSEIRKASYLKNPQQSLAICEIPKKKKLHLKLNPGLSVFLDDIQDPGNLGTIIRICDWFGVEELYCSPKTADMYNPKVIQASMGSFARINPIITDFDSLKKVALNSNTSIYGAFIDGKNIYKEKLAQNALLIMGNEGNGISQQIEEQIDLKIKIPEFTDNKTAESLNVSVATAVICAEFKRQNY